jgi:ribonuclease HI
MKKSNFTLRIASNNGSIDRMINKNFKGGKIVPQATKPSPKLQTFTAFFDGSYDRTKDKAGIGFVIYSPKKEIIWQASSLVTETDHLRAEYRALIALLEVVIHLGIIHIQIHGDNASVIRQLNGDSRVKSEERDLYQKANQLLDKIHDYQLVLVNRKNNKEAHKLSIQSYDSETEDNENERIKSRFIDPLKEAKKLKKEASRLWNQANELLWKNKKKPGFNSFGWFEQVGPHHYLWNEENDHIFLIDLQNNVCTCPDSKLFHKKCDHIYLLADHLKLKQVVK